MNKTGTIFLYIFCMVVAFGLVGILNGCPKPIPGPFPLPDADSGWTIPDSGWEPFPDASESDSGPQVPTWIPDDPCGSAYVLFDWAGCPRAGADGGTWVQICRNARQNGLTFGLTKTVQTCLSQATSKGAIISCGEQCQ
jgi:hypothetical protein